MSRVGITTVLVGISVGVRVHQYVCLNLLNRVNVIYLMFYI